MFGALDDIVDTSLAEEVRLRLLSRANSTVRWTLVHPFDAINTLLAARSLELLLKLLFSPLLSNLVDALLCGFALGERLLLCLPYCLLVPSQLRVERLLEVEITAAHVALLSS